MLFLVTSLVELSGFKIMYRYSFDKEGREAQAMNQIPE